MQNNRNRRRYDGFKFVHKKEPDYLKARIDIKDYLSEKILPKLIFLYEEKTAGEYISEIERICKLYYAHKAERMIDAEKEFDPREHFSERDVVLITYGDLIHEEGVSPLTTLSKFCGIYLKQSINTLHILPFYPYTSDKGFSVLDFESVDPMLGTWGDIEDLGTRYKLMFDAVINHVSSRCRWFRRFLDGVPRYQDFFISYKFHDELTPEDRNLIFRPRSTDVLSKFEALDGERYVWSTFSRDQVDLNYQNPEVLMRVIEILLLYVRKGADIIRLDAVTYFWVSRGTPCANLEQTHTIVKIFHEILSLVAPHVAIITETNVPHKENISYFGNGHDEAHMVYNFALPPLVLHTFYTKNTTQISDWASNLKPYSETTTFFNFLDSHDGVGLMAIKDILTQEETNFLIDTAQDHGAYISYKVDRDGNEVPYELNITWFSAICKEGASGPIELQINKFIASRAIALVLQGVPGIYLHSFFGTKNDRGLMVNTDTKRTINRTIINYNALVDALDNPDSLIARICEDLNDLISLRSAQSAFHPNGAQLIVKTRPEIFIVLRTSPRKDQNVLSLINVTGEQCHVTVPMQTICIDKQEWYDLIGQKPYTFKDDGISLTLEPYQVAWLKAGN
ncbi:MAG: sugar phosphorylase [Planctomycetes bacterium]|nr:sugar phosphorylase [Planctomycetota bacterium]